MVLHLKFTKSPQIRNLQNCQNLQKAVFVQIALKFTQKVTVNHMLPFPSALYTSVTLVYNKQTNKLYVNSDHHCPLPFMY